jgi:N-sulfoglucosamine sulfohydrolase
LLERREDPAFAKFFAMATEKRPAEELYDLRSDPDCLINLADNSDHARTKADLGERLADWMKTTADPRAANSREPKWDRYEYYGDPKK